MFDIPAPRSNPSLKNVELRGTELGGFKVLRKDSQILSLLIEGEGCGAYCESFQSSYAFDLSTGRKLKAEDILSEEGRRVLMRKIHEAAVKTIRDQMKQINKNTELDRESAMEVKDMYTECIDWHDGQANRTDGDLGSMRVSDEHVDFVLGRCSNHARRALDEIGDFNFRISYVELMSYLAPHGQKLLIDTTKNVAQGYPFGIGVQGNVGKAKVYVTMGAVNSTGEFSGSYYYERYRTPINLSGYIKENKIVLNEMNDKSLKQAEWILEHVGNAWVGSWNGNDGRKVPVRLQ